MTNDRDKRKVTVEIDRIWAANRLDSFHYAFERVLVVVASVDDNGQRVDTRRHMFDAHTVAFDDFEYFTRKP